MASTANETGSSAADGGVTPKRDLPPPPASAAAAAVSGGVKQSHAGMNVSGGGAGAAGTSGAGGAPRGAAGMLAQAGAEATDVIDFDALDCVLTPELTEGPFFIDEKLDRSDLMSGEGKNVSAGVPLELTMGLFRVEGAMCAPLAGVQIDVWHADVDGVYSDVESGFFQPTATSGQKFLRGYQLTDEQGVVRFKTIYPGWYGSRAIHIHFKVRVIAAGSAYEFTSQLFFDESTNDEVMALPAYNTRGTRTVLNKTDQVFNGTGPGAGPDNMGPPAGQKAPGEDVLLKPARLPNRSAYSATLKIGVRMS